MIEFYKARIGFFYDGVAEKLDFNNFENVVRDDVNAKVAMKSENEVPDFVGHVHPHAKQPMTVFAANYFKVVIKFLM